VSGRTDRRAALGVVESDARVSDVRLHCAERGSGPPVVFVHMGGADYRYWSAQLAPFAGRGYRAFSYSRRFAFPNANPMVSDYSPLVDAADLAALIEARDLAPAHVVASSIGACAALFLAADRPDLVRTLVLAEPPMLEWAREVPGGAALFDAFLNGVFRSAGAAFAGGDAVGAMRILMDYFVAPGALDAFPDRVRRRVMDNARDWAAHTRSRDPFPRIAREAVRTLRAPALLLSGGRSLPVHALIDAELESLLAQGRRVVLPEASHDVWGDAPERCRAETLAFLSETNCAAD
jgi:non-heme chloroperoxidase